MGGRGTGSKLSTRDEYLLKMTNPKARDAVDQ